jgi:hypothetical protein
MSFRILPVLSSVLIRGNVRACNAVIDTECVPARWFVQKSFVAETLLVFKLA